MSLNTTTLVATATELQQSHQIFLLKIATLILTVLTAIFGLSTLLFCVSKFFPHEPSPQTSHCDASCMDGWKPAKYFLEAKSSEKGRDEPVYSQAMIENWLEQAYQKEVADLQRWRCEKTLKARMQENRIRRSAASNPVNAWFFV